MVQIDFDQRDGIIWFNGKLIPWQEAKIHLMSHGLHYGSSVFEGERSYNGKIFKLKEHTERLFKSAKLLGFEIPYSIDEIIDATNEVIKISNIQDAYIRPIAWGGCDTMKITIPAKTNIAVAAWAWPSDYEESGNRLIKLCFSKWIKPDPRSVPCQSKAGGLYITCNLSSYDAKQNGYDDAIFIDYRGYIAEATAANIFMVKNNILYTPIADCFLNGITRMTIIDLAKSAGIEVYEKHILPEELNEADEVFLTGTAYEVTPVGSIMEINYPKGGITKILIEKYKNLVRT